MCVVLPTQMLKNSNPATNIDATLVTVNNFFAHWLKEIDIKRCPDDVRILPTNNTVSISDYSGKILKQMPEKALDTIKETLLYDKTKVVLTGNRDRRSNNSATAGDKTDASLGSRITEFHDLLSQKNYYRIPLKFFTNLGLVNLVHNTNTKFLFTLESNLNKLFESNAKVDHIPANPDAKIIYHDTPYICCQQIVLDDNFQAFQNASLCSKTALRTGIFNTPYQQSFDLNVGIQNRKINFYGTALQFEFLEISLVYDKSDQHQTIYDSYDVELAAKTIQPLTIKNASSTYSLTGIWELNIDNEDHKHQLYLMFIAYNWDGCSAVSLTQY